MVKLNIDFSSAKIYRYSALPNSLNINPREDFTINVLSRYIDSQDLVRIKTLILCLNRLEIIVPLDIIKCIMLYFANSQSVINRIKDLIEYPSSNIGTLYYSPGGSLMFHDNLYPIIHLLITKDDYCYGLYKIVPEIFYSTSLIILGFVCSKNDILGNIYSDSNILIKHETFYKRTMKFNVKNNISDEEINSNKLAPGKEEQIEFWTCSDFPLIRYFFPYSQVECKVLSKNTPLVLCCIIDHNIMSNDFRMHYINNDCKHYHNNLVYINGRVMSSEVYNILNS